MNSQAQKVWQRIAPVLLSRYQRDATFLDYQNPWQLLVAVILSAQTTDDLVNTVTPALFKKWKTPRAMAAASVAEIAEMIKRVNYKNAKAKYLHATADIVANKFKSVIPMDEELLQTLPGVGRKTAVAVLSNLQTEQIGIAVDTHVIRFAHRFKLSSSNNPAIIERDLCAIIPRADWRRASYAIKQYGRMEGRARNYKAEEDPLVKVLFKD
jgi:endonuclease-3